MIKIFLTLGLLFSWPVLSQDDKQPASFVLQEYAAMVPLRLEEVVIGEAKVKLRGEEVVALEKTSLLPLLKKTIKAAHWRPLEPMGTWIPVAELPFGLRFDPVNAWVDITIPVERRLAQRLDAVENQSDLLAGQALGAAPFGGAINYRLERAWGAEQLGGDTFSTFFDSFINMGGVVLEGQANYLDGNDEHGWFRGDTRLVKDFQSKRVRVEAGDVYPSNFGFMPARPVGGVHLARNFTLDPYRVPFPQGQGTFRLATRSQVRTYVNGVQIKEEVLPAGNYSLRDVPLINGLNTVLVEAIDETGRRRIYEFRLPTSVGLLRDNEWNFALSHGKPFLDTTFRRSYVEDEITSGYLQHGMTRTISLGAYAQHQSDFSLGGAELGYASNVGNWFVGTAASRDEGSAAGAGSLTWQLQNLGTTLFSTYTLTLRHERYGDGFQTQNDSSKALLRSMLQGNLTVPLRELLTLSLGASHGDVRDEDLADRKGWDTTLNFRMKENLNVSFFMSRTRDERKIWSDIAYVFFTWTFDSASHFISGFHDIENKVNRLTGVQDNANRLYVPRMTAIAEEGPELNSLEMEGFVPTPVADVGGRVIGAKYENDTETRARGAARLSSAFVFAYDRGELGVGLSRPVPNSFVLFKPSESLKQQKVSLRSTSLYTEGESGPFGEITFTNLLPYQFREVQLDPSGLDEGTSLVQEKFVLYPTYRSAHLIPLNDRGTVVVTGTLAGPDGQPLGLTVGQMDDSPFFTTREGRFFIDGLDPGTHQLKLEGYNPHELHLQKRDRGIKDIGTLTLSPEAE